MYISETGVAFDKILPEEYRSYYMAFENFLPFDTTLPKHTKYDCKIEFNNNKPIYSTHIPPLSSKEELALENHIDEYLSKGFIRPSKSNINHPVKFRTKKNGKLKVMVDFSNYNKKMIKFEYPLPKITDIFEKMKGATYFTHINLKSSFESIRVRQGDEFKTAIRTKFGTFEYLIMPEGLPDGTAYFQSFMEDIFKNIKNQFVQVYVDDIIVYSKNLSQHIEHVKTVLQILIYHHLVVNITKSQFNKTEIQYLGHVFCKDGMKIDPEKVQKIIEWPVPNTIEELQSFNGCCNFLRQYISNFSMVMYPLYLLTRKDQKKDWNNECQKSFSKIKSLIAHAPTLAFPDKDKPFYIQLNTNDHVISASLFQKVDNDDNSNSNSNSNNNNSNSNNNNNNNNANNQYKVIYYTSRILKNSELNYDEFKREELAIKMAMDEWSHLFIQHTIPIYTKNSKFYNQLNFFTYSILDEYVFSYDVIYETNDFTFINDPNNNNKNPNNNTTNNKSYNGSNNVNDNDNYSNSSSSDDDDDDDDENIEDEVTLKEIRYQYKYDDYAQCLMDDLKHGTNDTGYSYNWIISSGLLVRKYNMDQIYIPPKLRRSILFKTYIEHRGEHLSSNKIYDEISSHYWWPGLKQDIKDFFSERCRVGMTKFRKNMHIPWKVIYMEYLFDLKIKSGNRIISNDACIMIFRDYTTRMVHFIGFDNCPNSTLTSQAFFDSVFKHHGCPIHIISEKPIQSELWKQILRTCNSTHELINYNNNNNNNNSSNNYHKYKDKIYVEIYLRMFMKTFNNSYWKSFLSMAEACFNQSIHPSINQTPNNALYQYQSHNSQRKEHSVHHFSYMDKKNHGIWKKLKIFLKNTENKIYN